jgi:RNA polymerase sigma-70 factor (ECF subfamily)
VAAEAPGKHVARGALLRLAPEPTDAELVAAVAAGDRQAADWLIMRHAPRVTRVLARVLGGDPDLVDHAQEVLLRCVREIGTLRDPSAFRAWCTALAVMQARGVLRKRARWRWLFADRAEVDIPDDIDQDGREALHAVYDVLGRLSEEERTVFALRYLEGMELSELASAMGCSLATVKRKLEVSQRRFVVFAKREPALARWLASGRFAEEEGPT